MPETLFRLQRREYYRVPTSTLNPLKCFVPQPDGSELLVNVADISCGGVGLVDPRNTFAPEVGTILGGCRIELPEYGNLHCDLQVRNTFMQRQNDGNQVRRIGCAFIALPVDKNALIQRYIHRVQVELKAISGR